MKKIAAIIIALAVGTVIFAGQTAPRKNIGNVCYPAAVR
jgi:hypothetical protein